MAIISQIAFALIMIVTFGLFAKKAKEIYDNISMGQAEDLTDNPQQRLKNMLLVALGQKKMFRLTVPAMLHLFVYVAFLITQLELVEIFIDGLAGTHRILLHSVEGIGFLEGIYFFIISFIEILSVLALVATFAFLARRNLLKIPRFTKSEMTGWPKLDGNLILYFEIYLVTCIFMMNGADAALHPEAYGFAISSTIVGPLLSALPESTLHLIERIGWWGHILGVFAFLNYLPYSKHLHIMLAFPNTYFARLKPFGTIDNMPAVTKELKLMMDPNADPYAAPAEGEEEAAPAKFGAKDVEDLSWKNLLDAYSCTECGRCTAACPANRTEKLLSPRKIMMDTRDRMEDIAKGRKEHGPDFVDNKKLLGDYISVEELRACTTCQACVQECPIMINPLDIIVQLRRALIMEDSNSPEEWNLMFSNIENNAAPWQFSQQDRDKWVDELK